MSTHPMISVIAQEMDRLGYGLHESHAQSIWLKIQAEQHQGDPVALPAQHDLPHRDEFESADQYAAALGEAKIWNACLDEIAKLGSLYTHADPGEVVRFGIQVEKLLCEALGREWSATGISIETLVAELKAKADPCEVERLHKQLDDANQAITFAAQQAEEKQKVTDAMMADAKQFRAERDTLRAQLAEREALLRDLEGKTILSWPDKHRISAAISASAEPSASIESDFSKQKHDAWRRAFYGEDSAEPSAPAPMPAYMEAACDKFDWAPEEALRFYAEGKHFDVVAGRTRILCTGAIASHALKGIGGEYADMKGIEPSAPVDEVNFDLETMKAAVQGPMTRMPDGISREEFRAHMNASALRCGPGNPCAYPASCGCQSAASGRDDLTKAIQLLEQVPISWPDNFRGQLLVVLRMMAGLEPKP